MVFEKQDVSSIKHPRGKCLFNQVFVFLANVFLANENWGVYLYRSLVFIFANWQFLFVQQYLTRKLQTVANLGQNKLIYLIQINLVSAKLLCIQLEMENSTGIISGKVQTRYLANYIIKVLRLKYFS